MTTYWKRVLIVLTIAALATCFADSAVAAHRHHHHAHRHGGAVRYSYAPRVYAPYSSAWGYGGRSSYGGYIYPHHHHHHHGW